MPGPKAILSLPPIRDNLEDAKRDLAEIGMTRISGAASETDIAASRERLVIQAAAENAKGYAFRDDGATPVNTPGAPNQRVWNLVNKGDIFRRLVVNKIAKTLVREMLGHDILLFSFTANIAGKGGLPQGLHGDQQFAPVETPYPLLANCLWMLDEFTEENGATRVTPNSHRAGAWPDASSPPATAAATGPRGTMMVWDGRLWHGTGANLTDRPRHGLLAAYCRPFLRQQENSTLSVRPEVLAEASPELLALLGFRSWNGLGSMDGADHSLMRERPTAFSDELDLGPVK